MSLTSQHFRYESQCLGKRTFDSIDLARLAARRHRGSRPYRCPHCHSFHVAGPGFKAPGKPKAPPPEIDLTLLEE